MRRGFETCSSCLIYVVWLVEVGRGIYNHGFGGSWKPLRDILGSMGAFWSRLGGVWKHFRLWALVEVVLKALRVSLDAHRLGGVLRSWARLGGSWKRFGRS